MMHDLTDAFNIQRASVLEKRKRSKRIIIDLIKDCNDSSFCFVCGLINKGSTGSLCEPCFKRVHSDKFPEIYMENESTNQVFVDAGRFLKFLILDKRSFNSFLRLEEAKMYLNRNRDIVKIVNSTEEKKRRDKLIEFSRRRIDYKLKVVEDQINLNLKNYQSALNNTHLEDAEEFKKIHFDLWDMKIQLQERYYKL